MTLRSSRKFPGHRYAVIASIAALENAAGGLSGMRREEVQMQYRQPLDILPSLAKRRKPNGDDIEPIKKILAELVFAHGLR